MKRQSLLCILITSALFFGACGRAETITEPINEPAAEAELEESLSVEPIEEIATSDESIAIEKEIYENTDEIGNIVGNIYYEGLMAQKGSGTCYLNWDIIGTLYNGSESPTLIFPSLLSDMNVYEDFVYGIVQNYDGSGNHMVRQNLNTLECEVLRDASVDMLQLVNGTLYYLNLDRTELYSMDIETLEEVKLLERSMGCFTVYKDNLFIVDDDGLWKSDIDGSNEELIVEGVIWTPIINRDIIYFSIYNHGSYTLSCVSIDGGDIEVLDKLHVKYMNLDEDCLYYTNEDKAGILYCIDTLSDSKEVKEIPLSDKINEYRKSIGDENEYGVNDIIEPNISNGYILLVTVNISENGDSIEGEYYYDIHNDTVIGNVEYALVDMSVIEEQYDEWLRLNADEYARITGKEAFDNKPSEPVQNDPVITSDDDPIFNNGRVWEFPDLPDGIYDDMGRRALEVVNQYRAEAGLPPLAWNDTVYSACKVRAEELTRVFAHQRPDGTTCFTALEQAGMPMFNYCWGENIAFGQPTAPSACNSWYNSPPHRENMLNPAFSQGAVACYVHNGHCYWVNMFSN